MHGILILLLRFALQIFSGLSLSLVPMNTRNWNILCWNIRGINGSDKWDSVRDKINESACSIVCLQETKRDHFDIPFLRKFLPRRFDKFDFVPSIGALGGILVAWISNHFVGSILEKRQYGLTINFTSVVNLVTWKLTIVYGPCQDPLRTDFVTWLRDHIVHDDDNWIFLGILTSTGHWKIGINKVEICRILLHLTTSLAILV